MKFKFRIKIKIEDIFVRLNLRNEFYNFNLFHERAPGTAFKVADDILEPNKIISPLYVSLNRSLIFKK